MNWQRVADGMVIEQTGAGTLTVLTLTNEIETWEVGAEDGIGWFKGDDGTLDIFMRSSLAQSFGEFDVVATFGQGGWQCVRWEAANGNEAEGRP